MLLWSIKEKSPNFFLCVDKMEFIYTKYPFNVIITHFFFSGKKLYIPFFAHFFASISICWRLDYKISWGGGETYIAQIIKIQI